MSTIKLNFYTEEARNIVAAAAYYWSRVHRRTWFARCGKIDFDDNFAPSGEICINGCYATQSDIPMIAFAIKEMLRARYLERYKFVEETNQFVPDDNPVDREDKNNDRNIILKCFKFDSRGYRQYEYEYCKVNIKLAWLMYDLILNHRSSTVERKFGIDAIDRIVGHPRNPIEVEQATSKAMEINKINSETSLKIDETRKHYEAIISRTKNEMNDKIEELKRNGAKQIEQIELQFKELMEMSKGLTNIG